MNSLPKKRLGDIMTLHRGFDLPSSERIDGDIPVIGSSGICGSHNTPKLDGQSVITGRYGTIGKVFYHKGPCWPLNTTLYVSDFHGNNPRYIAYLLQYTLNTVCIDGTDKSTVPGIDRNVLHEIRIPFVKDRNTQDHIVDVLASIDDKINNNQEIVAELETTAQLICDEWFMQFDFPDVDGHPYQSSGGKLVWSDELKRKIPEGWKIATLGKLIRLNRGVSYSSKNLAERGTAMINLASFAPDGSYKENGIKWFSGNYPIAKVIKPYDLLICNTQQTALNPMTDIIGKPLLVPDIFSGPIISSHHVTTISLESEDLKYYLYSIFRTSWFASYITGYASGTSILGLDDSGLKNLAIPIPDQYLLHRYAKLVASIETRISEMIRENTHLATLRDWLLPLFVTGQATIIDTL